MPSSLLVPSFGESGTPVAEGLNGYGFGTASPAARVHSEAGIFGSLREVLSGSGLPPEGAGTLPQGRGHLVQDPGTFPKRKVRKSPSTAKKI